MRDRLVKRGAFFVALSLVACTGGGAQNDADVCAPYQVPSGTSLTTPVVSFQSDVLPIFETSCGLSASCHGAQMTTTGRVFLGSSQVPTNATMVAGGIVGVLSTDLPTMPYVTAGDPSKSFLLHKMDGDQCVFDSACAPSGAGCGVSMPQNLPLLETSARDTVRRWIAQGAVSN